MGTLKVRGRRVAWMLAALVATSGSAMPAAAQQAVTLAEAVDRALQRSPVLAQSRATLDNAAGATRLAWGAFLPDLSASSSASLSSSERFDPGTQRIVSGSSESYNAGLSVSYQVFAGGRRFAELDRSRADRSAAGARFEDQRFGITLQTELIFFGVLRQSELLEVQRARLARAEESLELIRTQVILGSATRSDTLRARLELSNARQAELVTGTALRAARIALGRQIGVAGPVDAVTPDDLEPRPLALSDEEIISAAAESSPRVAAARAEGAAASAAVSSARTAYLPTLNLSSGYSWSNTAASFVDGRTSWNLRLSASYPLFNGFGREENIDRAESSVRVARLQEEDAALQAGQDADAALQTLRTSELQIEIAREAVTVAQEDLRVVQARYRLGVAAILDLITSQVAVEQAEADLVTARYDYLLARAELEAILGREL